MLSLHAIGQGINHSLAHALHSLTPPTFFQTNLRHREAQLSWRHEMPTLPYPPHCRLLISLLSSLISYSTLWTNCLCLLNNVHVF